MPRSLYGPIDERNQDYANAGNANLGRFPLGHILITPDNREYRFALNDGTVEVAASLYQSVAPLSDHTDATANVARAIDATTISATLNGTSDGAAVDIYAEGIVHTNNDTGEGYAYRIKRAMTAGLAHASAASAAVLTVNLEPGEQIQVAIDTTTEVTFTRNRFHAVLLTAAPPTAGLAGVSPGVAAANRFYWSQVKGYAAVLASGTLLAGLPVMAGITTAGSVESYKRRAQTGGTTVAGVVPSLMVYARALSASNVTTDFLIPLSVSTGATALYDISGPIAINGPVVGMCIKANSTTQQALIDLMLPTS